MENVCCTCAEIVSHDPVHDASTEKAISNKRLDCCGRLVCASCIARNPRFETYCTFCQTPTPLTEASQAPPPAYSDTFSFHTPPPAPHPQHAVPAYSASDEPPQYDGDGRDGDVKHPDVMHYLSPEDSMTSLSLRYRVPLIALRQLNNLWSDHLLSARRIILIPGQYYQGPSLAPDPIEDEEESERKSKIRRLMTKCKIHEYDIAVLYLEQEQWDFESAFERYQADERWEKQNPLKGKHKAAQSRNLGRRLQTRQ